MKVTEVPVSAIAPNPYQTRETIAKEPLALLAKSIRERGLFNPITVLQDGEKFIVVHGHRRLAAFRRLRRKTIPAFIKPRKGKDTGDLIVDLIQENLIREDLNPGEKAKSIQLLLSTIKSTKGDVGRIITLINISKLYRRRGHEAKTPRSGFSSEEMFRCMKLLAIIGMSENRAIDFLTILKLPRPMQKAVTFGRDSAGKINIEKAYQLARVQDDAYRKLLFEKAASGTPTKVIQALVDVHIEKVNKGEWEGITKTIGSTWKNTKSDDRLIEISSSCHNLSKKLNSWKLTKLIELSTRFSQEVFCAAMKELKKEIRILDAAIDRHIKDKGYVGVEKWDCNEAFETRVSTNHKRHTARCIVPQKVLRGLGLSNGGWVKVKIVGVKPPQETQGDSA